jgi:hypothetical protein
MPPFLKKTFLLFILAAQAACRQQDNTTLFTQLAPDDTGISFQNTLFDNPDFNILKYSYFYNGGGVAIGDINNDGLPDILFTGNMVKNRLYLNKGNFKFENITDKAGIAEKQGWCTGATMVDINGDGKLDIYICRSADGIAARRKNLLFINNGDLSFTEKAAEYGLDNDGFSTQAGFFDYDKDGDLDMFLINHSLQQYTTGAAENPAWRNEKNPAFECKLYRNDLSASYQHPVYTDVTAQAGITSNVLTFGLGLAISDLNNDGWPDLYVSNDFNEADYLFINNRNGTFSNQLAKAMDYTSLYSMGSDAADYDNDGLTDLVTLDMLPEDNNTIKMHSGAENFDKFQTLFSHGFYKQYSRNMLQHNNGDGSFSELGQMAGISNTDWSWSALLADYDNDGYKDLFVTNGYVKDYTEMDFVKYSVDRSIKSGRKDSVEPVSDYIRKMPSIKIPNYIFQNQGNGTFRKKTIEWGLNQDVVSAGAAYADLDNDGDLDLVINNTNEPAGIYRNNSERLNANHYLRIRLDGPAANRRAIGAKVKLYCGSKQFYQEESPVRAFQSSSDPVLDFGTGISSVIDSAIVIWPNGRFQKLTAVHANQLLTLNIKDATAGWAYDTIAATNTLLSQTTMAAVVHHENSFNDFTVQSLLPNYLSRQGPCIAVSDVNRDGLEDFFMGGAKDHPGQLFLQKKNHDFIAKTVPAFAADAASEDVSAVFFDADGDGDADLYVASGGYEFTENDPSFQDRLYINDGKGNFQKKANALPALLSSKSCVRVADIDGDGDMDLFLGGRLVPGKYPLAPRSYILLNDGRGNFTDATQSVCTALLTPGMITDACWADVNNDNQPDLIVAGEWMPVKIFINSRGVLRDASPAYIHFASTGWWNSISAADMDGDGDIDFVLGNCGTNTQFRVSEKEPMTLYYKDFDGNGSIDPVVCYFTGGASYPAASRDDLTEQVPSLKKKFLTYKQYAGAGITDIFSPDQLKDAAILKAETMHTVYLENQGSKGFVMHDLPVQAQYAPVSAIILQDINEDGKKDMLLAGNNSWTRIKFGSYDANRGVLLLGDGKNNFSYVPQTRSGLSLQGNIKSLQPVNTGNSKTIIAGVNDGHAVMIKINKR